MSVHLFQSGKQVAHFSDKFWIDTLAIASMHGWTPSGTVPPGKFGRSKTEVGDADRNVNCSVSENNESDWSGPEFTLDNNVMHVRMKTQGNYTSQYGQTLTSDDAVNLGRALRKYLSLVDDIRFFVKTRENPINMMTVICLADGFAAGICRLQEGGMSAEKNYFWEILNSHLSEILLPLREISETFSQMDGIQLSKIAYEAMSNSLSDSARIKLFFNRYEIDPSNKKLLLQAVDDASHENHVNMLRLIDVCAHGEFAIT